MNTKTHTSTILIEDDQLINFKNVKRKSLEEYAKPYGGRLGPYDEYLFGEGIGIENWLDKKNCESHNKAFSNLEKSGLISARRRDRWM